MSTNCSNCFNGCAQIVSDKCVKYTGLPSEALQIETGDTLLSVEETLINKIVSFLDGTGIDITIDPAAYCDLVTQYLPTCKPICNPPTAVELFEALVKAACDLRTQVENISIEIDTIEAPYAVDCLTGVTASSGTHAVVQAVINKLCELEIDLEALATDVDTNYVKLADLNSLIAAYLSSTAVENKYYTKMVPYTALEYYGPLTNYPTVSDGFSGAGIGYGYWEKVYLCNGLNGTPDKRGRVAVGVTSGMGGGAFAAAVDPAIAGNPTYTIGSTAGSNTVTLTSAQIPGHTHPATASITDPGHEHDILGITGGDNDDMSNTVRFAGGDKDQTETSFFFTNTQACQSATTGISAAITVNNNVGGDGAHANNQPALACYYIMYLP